MTNTLQKAFYLMKRGSLLSSSFVMGVFFVFISLFDTSNLYASNSLPNDAELSYQSTLTAYKAGRCDHAVSTIKELMTIFPDVERLKSDYIAISVGCGQYDNVVGFINPNYVKGAPPYVKEALLEAAIHEKDIERASIVQRQDTKPSADLMSLMIDGVYREISAQDLAKADKLSLELVSLYPDQQRALDARAYTLRESGKPLDALKTYQYIQMKFPKDKNAPVAIANLLVELGMPQIAEREVISNHVKLSVEDQLRLRKAVAVKELRWSDTFDDNSKSKNAYLDKAIEQLVAARRFVVDNGLDNKQAVTIDFDLIVAYDLRHKYKKSIELYESLVVTNFEVPDYVILAVADSYNGNREYLKSEKLLREYLEKNPNNFEAQLGLYHALIDLDRFDDASAVVEQLSANYRSELLAANKRFYKPGEYRGFIELIKQRYTNLQIAEAMGLAYRDKLEQANNKINNILDAVPASDEALTSKGHIELWMGNPEKSEEYFKIVSNASPDNVDARIGLGEAKFNQREFASAKEALSELQKDYSELRGVEDLAKRIHNRDSPLVTGDFEFSNGKATTQTLSAATADMRVYSDPLAENYRIYGRFRGLYSGPAVQSNVSAGALGVKYEGPGHEISVEGGDRGYAKLEGTKYVNDSLSGSLSFERNGFFLFPGALYPTYTGNVLGGIINWKKDDTQKAFVGYQYWSLTNNNQTQAFANFDQRLLTDYNYRLNGSVWVGNQQNTNPNVGYFAPWNQTEYSGTATLEFMQWRDLSTKSYSFWHKFWGTYGVVTQQGFSTLPMNSFGYGQNFTFGDKQRLVWGLGRTYFPFDGVKSSYLNGYLRFEKSF